MSAVLDTTITGFVLPSLYRHDLADVAVDVKFANVRLKPTPFPHQYPKFIDAVTKSFRIRHNLAVVD